MVVLSPHHPSTPIPGPNNKSDENPLYLTPRTPPIDKNHISAKKPKLTPRAPEKRTPREAELTPPPPQRVKRKLQTANDSPMEESNLDLEKEFHINESPPELIRTPEETKSPTPSPRQNKNTDAEESMEVPSQNETNNQENPGRKIIETIINEKSPDFTPISNNTTQITIPEISQKPSVIRPPLIATRKSSRERKPKRTAQRSDSTSMRREYVHDRKNQKH
ncbi:histone H3.v1-like [Venturia canescens]|uniref:histone H3.v1-like n=1 Tax=Venturia canescens TaxID=32260 RepID=UPI001C9D2DD3|nr:histone H3.v1-like [Venturia canescens]